MRRYDEIYAKDSLEKYLSKSIKNFMIVEGDDPPDYYVLIDNSKVLLEVTRAEPIYLDNNGIGNRNTNDESILRFCEHLNHELGSKIDPQKTLYLHIKGPVDNFSKFKKSLRNIISSSTFDINLYTDGLDVLIEGNVVRFVARNSTEEAPRITGLASIAYKNALPNIEVQAGLIIRERIEEKERKTKLINGSEWHGEKWLAILNGYILASSATYINALRKQRINHTFSKIFLIDADYKVTDLLISTTYFCH